MVWAWEVDTADATFASRYHRAALDEGLLLRPIGTTLYFMPPYVLTEVDQRHLAEGAVRVLDRVLADEHRYSGATPEAPVP
jgi:adenosylmethionine-8-amino-7-oxononanoate aminotransferase